MVILFQMYVAENRIRVGLLMTAAVGQMTWISNEGCSQPNIAQSRISKDGLSQPNMIKISNIDNQINQEFQRMSTISQMNLSFQMKVTVNQMRERFHIK